LLRISHTVLAEGTRNARTRVGIREGRICRVSRIWEGRISGIREGGRSGIRKGGRSGIRKGGRSGIIWFGDSRWQIISRRGCIWQ